MGEAGLRGELGDFGFFCHSRAISELKFDGLDSVSKIRNTMFRALSSVEQ